MLFIICDNSTLNCTLLQYLNILGSLHQREVFHADDNLFLFWLHIMHFFPPEAYSLSR